MQKISRTRRHAFILAGLIALTQSAMALAFRHQPVELMADVLYIAVLLVAMAYGRRSGSFAALAATLVYAVFLALNVSSVGQSFHVLGGLVPIPVFGIIGIVGGEYAHKLRYSLASMHGSQIDHFSGLYNQHCIHDELVVALARFARYGEVCSILLLTLPPQSTKGLAAADNRKLVRAVAERMRSTLRTVDRIGHLDTGQYLALMPHTPAKGAAVARKRLLTEVKTVLGKDVEPSARMLALPEDEAAIKILIASMAPADSDQPSMTYSSSADITRNSDDASVASASSLSTLNTSTAPLPEGLTKQ